MLCVPAGGRSESVFLQTRGRERGRCRRKARITSHVWLQCGRPDARRQEALRTVGPQLRLGGSPHSQTTSDCAKRRVPGETPDQVVGGSRREEAGRGQGPAPRTADQGQEEREGRAEKTARGQENQRGTDSQAQALWDVCHQRCRLWLGFLAHAGKRH